MMTHLNKVSPASPAPSTFLELAKGPMRVGAARTVGLLWLLPVGVSFEGSCSLVHGATTDRFLQPSKLVVKDCRCVLVGCVPADIF